MSGPRDPSELEAKQYRFAIELREEEMLHALMRDQCPNVVWGNVTSTLSEGDRAWLNSVLRDPPPNDDNGGWTR